MLTAEVVFISNIVQDYFNLREKIIDSKIIR